MFKVTNCDLQKDIHITDKNNQDITLQGFVNDIKTIINTARTNAVRSVDFCRVQMYWAIGQRIVEKEQQGKERADYGTYLIKNLAKEIEPEYGSGFGVRQLERCRQFYTIYPIASTLRTQLFPNGVEYKPCGRWRRMYFGGQELSGNRQQGEEECGRTRIGTDRHYFMGRPHCFFSKADCGVSCISWFKRHLPGELPFYSCPCCGHKKTRLFLSEEARLNVSYC